MRKWYLPMTVLGLGGLGILLFTDRGRKLIAEVSDYLSDAPALLAEWNDTAQREMDKIQNALNRVADSLETV